MKKRILLTGATGFVGSFILEGLLHHGHEVVGIHRKALEPSSRSLMESGRCQFIKADLTQDFELPAGIDAVVHTAAQASPVGQLMTDYLDNNVRATRNLVKKAISGKVRKIVNLSSLSVYGQISETVVDETTAMTNVSPYGMSKYLAEQMLEESAAEIASVSLRLPGILGHGNDGPWLMKVRNQVSQNMAINISNPDSLFNNAVHVSDVSRWVISLLDRELDGTQALTAGAKDAITVRETVENLIELCHSPSTITASTNDRGTFTISNERAISDYGYEPSSMKQILQLIAGKKTLTAQSAGPGSAIHG